MIKLIKQNRLMLAILGIAALVATSFQNCSNVSFSQGKGGGSPQSATGSGDGTNGTSGTPGTGGVPGDDASGQIPQNGGTTGGPPVTGGPGGTTNPIHVPPGFPPPPPGSTDAPPIAPPGSTYPPGVNNTPPTVPPGTILPKVRRGEPPCIRLTWCEYELQLDKTYDKVVDFDWRTNDDLSRVVTVPAGRIRAIPNTHYVPGSGHVRFLPGELVRKIYVLNINPDPTIDIVIPFLFSSCKYGMAGISCVAAFN